MITLIPSLPNHTDDIANALSGAFGKSFIQFQWYQVLGTDNKPSMSDRIKAAKISKRSPKKYACLAHQAAIRLKQEGVNIVVFSNDWFPSFRMLAQACNDVGLSTVLVPHEAAFANRNKYYRCPLTGADTPVCQWVLPWGRLQTEIFIERGVSPDSIVPIGSLKLDAYLNYTPIQDRATYATTVQLDPEGKWVMFAAQPMDIQYNSEKKALAVQEKAILELCTACQKIGKYLIVRNHPARPPARQFPNALGRLKRISTIRLTGIGSSIESAPALDCFHADMLFTINSTMLLEAHLLDKAAYCMDYLPCDRMWRENARFPYVEPGADLTGVLSQSARKSLVPANGRKWLAEAFSVGKFDGKSSERLVDFLKRLIRNKCS